MYRASLLSAQVIRSRDYLSLAPRQDDLWFNLAARAMKTPVLVAAAANDQVFPVQTRVNLSRDNARGGDMAGWNHFFRALLMRAGLRVRAYLGLPACDNDRVFRNLQDYLARLQG